LKKKITLEATWKPEKLSYEEELELKKGKTEKEDWRKWKAKEKDMRMWKPVEEKLEKVKEAEDWKIEKLSKKLATVKGWGERWEKVNDIGRRGENVKYRRKLDFEGKNGRK
jgi:hypothetical protein